MANGHGGARKGAGRKPKPLSQKISEGNPGHRPLKKIEFADEAQPLPESAPEYLKHLGNPISGIPRPEEIYMNMVRYLEPSGCLPLIPADLLSDYAVAKHCLFLAQNQLAISAIVALNGQKEWQITDFTKAMIQLQKNALATWAPIWDIVSRNSVHTISNPEEEMMKDIMAGRVRKKRAEGTDNG